MTLGGFDVLSIMFGDDYSVAPGTWFFVESNYLHPPLPPKDRPRSVVASKESTAETVIVYPRSASLAKGHPHAPHVGHACDATEAHSRLWDHDCHVNKDGHVDTDTPIPLSLALLRGRRMCFEDAHSPMLAILEDEPGR
jgi:hypothetical protein